ncbi:hypothetical protein IHE44_0002677 [Lamprotornis superbus]|uniref:small monomeric GTPase n=1 Tax=Lamprotornis superbus TaxID=245042 RepID=A0A835U2G1_9PASS|nr:hypothetical protein IHE44_0002677 [Lamprotornis superbus]
MAKTYDYLFKLLLIGDSGVGKTCLLFRFSEDAFNTTFISTIGIDFKIRTIELDGKKIKLQIWDTAGQERFRTITTAYYRGAMGIMLVYDITNEKSFDNIKNWIRNIEEHASSDVERMILGNKCDMNEKRQVSKEKGEKLAIDYGIKFLETSAKSSINVEEAFFTLARDIMTKLNRKMNDNSSSGAGGPVKITERVVCKPKLTCSVFGTVYKMLCIVFPVFTVWLNVHSILVSMNFPLKEPKLPLTFQESRHFWWISIKQKCCFCFEVSELSLSPMPVHSILTNIFLNDLKKSQMKNKLSQCFQSVLKYVSKKLLL